jgi:hypothetical protein
MSAGIDGEGARPRAPMIAGNSPTAQGGDVPASGNGNADGA